MLVDLTINNHPCFAGSKPAHIVLRDGFTAFVGVNNSGKSSLLKFFFELRPLFDMPTTANSEFLQATKGPRPRRE
jgi:AAA15 family ATPase/GTPase